jgi:hypothetical protein
MNVLFSGLMSPCTTPLAWQSCKASTMEAMIWKTLALFKALALVGSAIKVRRLAAPSSTGSAREYRCTTSLVGSKLMSSPCRLQPRQWSRILWASISRRTSSILSAVASWIMLQATIWIDIGSASDFSLIACRILGVKRLLGRAASYLSVALPLCNKHPSHGPRIGFLGLYAQLVVRVYTREDTDRHIDGRLVSKGLKIGGCLQKITI